MNFCIDCFYHKREPVIIECVLDNVCVNKNVRSRHVNLVTGIPELVNCDVARSNLIAECSWFKENENEH